MFTSIDTIAAPATPTGISAIAVVRASGPEVRAIIRGILGEEAVPRQVRHADYRAADGGLIDDVVLAFFAGPHSFTGEDTLEVSCHGNPFIVQRILADLVARGCRPAEAGEFSRRAFLNGRMDLTQAEAVMDLIHAQSDRALAAANQQLRGALSNKAERIISIIINALARVEAYIDFPEEDFPAQDRADLVAKLREAFAETNQLLATKYYGEVLRGGLKTVILGEPNAGKSSLLNQLVGHDRALVSDEPGTTRDYLEERIRMGPHSLRLVDTAGLNLAAESLERLGIEKTLQQAAGADIFLWVVDTTKGPPTLPAEVAIRLKPENTLLVLNKSDLPQTQPASTLPYPFPRVSVSALLGDGLEELRTAIIRMADRFQITVGEDIIAINGRHGHALENARAGLEASLEKLVAGDANELLASDLRSALAALAEIGGKVDSDRILDELFSAFCIGK